MHGGLKGARARRLAVTPSADRPRTLPPRSPPSWIACRAPPFTSAVPPWSAPASGSRCGPPQRIKREPSPPFSLSSQPIAFTSRTYSHTLFFTTAYPPTAQHHGRLQVHPLRPRRPRALRRRARRPLGTLPRRPPPPRTRADSLRVTDHCRERLQHAHDEADAAARVWPVQRSDLRDAGAGRIDRIQAHQQLRAYFRTAGYDARPVDIHRAGLLGHHLRRAERDGDVGFEPRIQLRPER
jgi:hypothetical protein